MTAAKTSRHTLDLDAIEREGVAEPFTVTLGGKTYELADPKDYDWRDILAAQQRFAAGDPADAVRMLVPESDRDEFFLNPLPAWKLEKLFESYNEHWGLTNLGEADASPG